MKHFSLALGILIACCQSGFAGQSGAATGAAPASPGDQIWLLPGVGEPTLQVSVAVAVPSPPLPEGAAVAFPAFPASDTIPILCGIEAENPYANVLARLNLFDEQGAQVAASELGLQLNKGPNTCTFRAYLGGLQPGHYQGLLAVDYTEDGPEAKFKFGVRKVRPDLLLAKAGELGAQVDALATRLPPAPPLKSDRPYEQARLAIMRLALSQARHNGELEQWQDMDYRLRYVAHTLETVRAGAIFENLSPELKAPLPDVAYDHLEIKDGGWFSGDTPVFLAGAFFKAPQGARIAELGALGLNLAALYVTPAVPPGGLGPMAPAFQDAAAAMDAAEAANMATLVELAPIGSGTDAEPGWPRVEDQPFLDLTLASTRDYLVEHLRQSLPMLQEKKSLLAVGVAQRPRFKFRGEEVRAAFLNRVKTMYPQRSDLNQAWRSHLAKYDEIELWASKPDPDPEDGISKPFDPLSSYQDRRPFIYDWTTFHQELITNYFAYLRAAVVNAAPRVPVFATIDANVFENGETRFGPNHEDVQREMDISGTAVGLDQADKYYAYTYPRQSGNYALLRSFAPEQPVANLRNEIDLEPVTEADVYFKLLHASLWEGAVSGLSLSAVPAGSQMWKHPPAIEGYVTANLDLNRLGRVVHALQMAPVDIAILFSESSKIIDEGKPHLESAIFAYEGCSFSGYNAGFVTEDEIVAGALAHVRVLVIPETPALRNATFDKLMEYVQGGGTVARVGTPIPYNEYGISRRGVLRNTAKTVLVRGINLPTEYLHAMDAVMVLGALPPIPRAINRSGYPLEGVKTRYVEVDGTPYLYVLNVRKQPVQVYLAGNVQEGREVIRGRDVKFPMEVAPLEPMLVRMSSNAYEATVVAVN